MSLFKSSTLATPALRKKKRRIFWVRIFLAVVLVCVIVVGLAALSRLKMVTIQHVTAQGNSLITPSDIENLADKELEGNYFLLFSKRNALFYPKAKIKEDIVAAYPILSHVELSLKGLTTLEVTVAERTPKALWCAYDASIADPFTDSCFLMDATGYIYLKAPEFKGNPYIKYYGKISGDPIGASFEPDKLSKLAEFVEGVRSLALTPLSLYAEENGDYVLSLRGGGKLMFNDDTDYSLTLINLGTVLQDNISLPSKRESSIDYIDLRYGNRVFFKLRGAAKAQTATSTQSR